jgi:hypothetical protein
MNTAISNEVKERVVSIREKVAKLKGYKVTSGPTYQKAVDALKQTKEMQKFLNGERRKMTKPLDDAKKAVMEFFKAPLEEISLIEGFLKQGMAKYNAQQQALVEKKEREEREKREAEKAEKRKKLEEAKKNKDAQAAAELE